MAQYKEDLMSQQSQSNRTPAKRGLTNLFKFTAVSPAMLFRTIILFSALLVAAIAILRGTTDPNAWTFLGSIIIYAALTNGNSDSKP
jgi:hypothetical protein